MSGGCRPVVGEPHALLIHHMLLYQGSACTQHWQHKQQRTCLQSFRLLAQLLNPMQCRGCGSSKKLVGGVGIARDGCRRDGVHCACMGGWVVISSAALNNLLLLARVARSVQKQRTHPALPPPCPAPVVGCGAPPPSCPWEVCSPSFSVGTVPLRGAEGPGARELPSRALQAPRRSTRSKPAPTPLLHSPVQHPTIYNWCLQSLAGSQFILAIRRLLLRAASLCLRAVLWARTRGLPLHPQLSRVVKGSTCDCHRLAASPGSSLLRFHTLKREWHPAAAQSVPGALRVSGTRRDHGTQATQHNAPRVCAGRSKP